MKFGISADWHFGRGGDKGIERQARICNEIIDGWIAAGVTDGFILGDTFDKYILFGEYTYSVVSGILKRAIAADITLHAIKGSHDIARDGIRSAINPLEDIGVFVQDSIKDIGTCSDWNVTLVPWITKVGVKAKLQNAGMNTQDVVINLHEYVMSELEKIITGKPYVNRILMTHASFVGFSPCDTAASITGTDFVLDPVAIKALGFRKIISGHFHGRQWQKDIGYVGSPERLNHGEAGNPCGWLELNFDEDEITEKWHELSGARRFWTIANTREYPIVDFVPANVEDYKGAVIKLRPEFSHNDVIDYEALKAPYIEAGAEYVDVDVQWTDEISLRSNDIRADQSESVQFGHWAEANPDKATEDVMKLLQFENEKGYPDAINNEYVEEAMRGIA